MVICHAFNKCQISHALPVAARSRRKTVVAASLTHRNAIPHTILSTQKRQRNANSERTRNEQPQRDEQSKTPLLTETTRCPFANNRLHFFSSDRQSTGQLGTYTRESPSHRLAFAFLGGDRSCGGNHEIPWVLQWRYSLGHNWREWRAPCLKVWGRGAQGEWNCGVCETFIRLSNNFGAQYFICEEFGTWKLSRRKASICGFKALSYTKPYFEFTQFH